MHSGGAKSPGPHLVKIIARACTVCRVRKIRCDMVRPRCTSCVSQDRDCTYHLDAPRKRPTIAQINDLQGEKAALESFITSLKNAPLGERNELLVSVSVEGGLVRLPDQHHLFQQERVQTSREAPFERRPFSSDAKFDDFSDEEPDVASFISVDEAGNANIFGPSSSLHFPTNHGTTSTQSTRSMAVKQHVRDSLIANAALQRQSEHNLTMLADFDDVPTELALHLLDLHWNRQHHTLLLTYRPAIMRDLLHDGPCCSRFLLNAIFACSSKFSQRVEVRDDPAVPGTTGRRFFRRCDELLAQDALLIYPSLPTVSGLLLLGLTYNARGETSKGWLYTGYALRMVYDLGLHIDPEETNAGPEEVELRRRVFWGAFICDKLQSLYLGRPAAINLRDAHVSRDFMDTFEEKELWMPYIDPQNNMPQSLPLAPLSPIYSVSTFQHFCSLSRIMTSIINRFYVVGATFSNSKTSLQRIDNALQAWKQSLPSELDYEPWLLADGLIHHPPPNVMNLHCIYHALIILLHRPFISDGHLRSTTTPELSWKRCTSAAKSITSISLAYQTAWTLTSAPYLLSYAIYVGCTIHVRNAAAEGNHSREHSSSLVASLRCLKELCSANPGVSKPLNIITRLMAANKLRLSTEDDMPTAQSVPSVDLGAILSMFPTKNNTAPNPDSDGWNDNSDSRAGFDEVDLFQDPLYGHMDFQIMPFSDVPNFLLDKPMEL